MVRVDRFMNSDEMDKEFLGKQLAIRYDDAVSGKNRAYDRAYVLAAYDNDELPLMIEESRRTGVRVLRYMPSKHENNFVVGLLEGRITWDEDKELV